MTYQCFDLSIEEKIAHLHFKRGAEFNTMQPVFFRELSSILDTLQRQASARVLVISSSGKHFTAGMALDVFTSGSMSLDDQQAVGRANIALLLQEMQASFNQIEALRMPVIAAIHGGCIGGGVDLICAADIRLASSDAFFCIQEINIGMTADLGTLQRLPKLIPEGIVHEMAYTGRRLPAARALAVGLVNEVFADQAAMLSAAMQMAKEIAAKPPLAIWGSKQAIHYARDHSTHDALQQMGWLQSGIWQSSNLLEAFMAKQQGRPAQYADLPALQALSQSDYQLK
ncbi:MULTISPECIES: enoyl-CoA hydratase-related protein [unclassified Undibacterium]|uniref:enoyl-CoA hydratase-related protein n=1 Tax=unclassified Undibacterium TaxID=2630295 RepID=UPI002AC9D1F5|nr:MULTISPECIES: enoyl-CoA hydratase-related protein [unclassified Undibacterium]MEB0138913.1 enoyl-CoA hydratase-related protein [Undibacterium sp. CCC2.1]MEB0171756.1 enoyl-CoA hydratase-related protein [Undibacterium sp. CCC1.1]MEB0175544.1 enoyl-CoA hydratase-related protein [Undibacterium sp. CCC3.4]MEB0214958.1 enoyl-CoA hydratase-related protein [Undibacterium sp. 5I2]WPX44939.1 enoyl-CoA hydratase-related protein [Undibacterium sp. CCC3.4]